jgi:hypothetical protein
METELKDEYIYQAFWFKNEIKKWFYAGDGFIAHQKNLDMSESLNLAMEMIGDVDAFMPGLASKIESLIGKENCIYDFWEFGDEDFSMYWSIKKDVYPEKMKLISEWVKYEELEGMMEFNIKDI